MPMPLAPDCFVLNMSMDANMARAVISKEAAPEK